MKPKIDEILPLTGLRFVAAFYVFVFHMNLRWPIALKDGFFSNLIGQGAVGMSLFFLLSGFLLAYRYGDGRGGYRSFVINRFSRIYPVYMVAALLTVPWMGISISLNSAFGFIRSVVAVIGLIAIDATLLQAWFPQLFEMWNNSGSWSISVEAFCYALLPFILAKATKLTNRNLLALSLASYALAILPGLTLIFFYGEYGLSFYSLPIYRLPEFVIGVCTAIAALRMKPRPVAVSLLQLSGTGFLFIYLGIVGGRLPMWIAHNWIVLPVIAITIFSTAQSFGIVSRILSWGPLVWSGKISYCFYSFQLFILLFLKSKHNEIILNYPLLTDNRLLLLAAFVILMIMSALGYHFIEEPARIYIKRRLAKSSQKPIIVGDGRAIN